MFQAFQPAAAFSIFCDIETRFVLEKHKGGEGFLPGELSENSENDEFYSHIVNTNSLTIVNNIQFC